MREKMKELFKQKLHKEVVIFTIVCFIIAAIILIACCVVEYSQPKYSYKNLDKNIYDIQYKSVYIKSDKNVWTMAEDIRKESEITGNLISTMDETIEIIRINNLNKNGDIKYGNYIIIPYVIEKEVIEKEVK